MGTENKYMGNEVLKFSRKRDFQVEIWLNPEDVLRSAELVDAIYRVKPSFLLPRLTIEVYQPITGRVHETVNQICKSGVNRMRVSTLVPDGLLLASAENTGHIVFLYETGVVIYQETDMSKDVIDGDDFMVHHLIFQFDNETIQTRELYTEDNVVRPEFEHNSPRKDH